MDCLQDIRLFMTVISRRIVQLSFTSFIVWYATNLLSSHSKEFIANKLPKMLFRDSWWDLRRQLGKVNPSDLPTQYAEDHKIGGQDFDEPEKERLDHVEHCIDYIRQCVSCWADTTLEAPALHPDGSRTNTDGMNTKHKCWDMEAVWKQYLDRRVPVRFVSPGGMIH